MTGDQRIFMLTLVARPGDDPTHGIRHILKLALRRYGLRCTSAREIAPPLQPERTQANANTDRRHGRENAFHRNSTGNDRLGGQDGGTGTTFSGSDS